MKNLLLSLVLGVVVLAGAGCAAGSVVSTITGGGKVEGKWALAFDLPTGWVMVGDYETPRSTAVTPSQDVNRNLNTVILQSTDKAIVESGTPKDSVPADSYATTGYTMIRVDKLDARRVIPKDAEDLGNGFSKDGSKYYFQTSEGVKYQFIITSNGGDEEAAKAIILSAKPVTVFTDSPTATTGEGATTTE